MAVTCSYVSVFGGTRAWRENAGQAAGTAVHYVTVNVRRKGWPSYTLVHAAGEVPQGSLRCELHVTHVEHVALSGPALQLVGSCSAYESEILLVTGRTHQVRALKSCKRMLEAMHGRLLLVAQHCTAVHGLNS